MKYGKNIWLIIIIIICLSTVVFAAGETQVTDQQVFSLDKCLQLGFLNNTQLLISKNSIEIYQKEVRKALGKYLPTLSYGFDKTYVQQTNSYGSITDNSYNGNVSISQPLYAGGKIDTGYKIAKLQLELALEDQRKAEQDLNYQIRIAFFDMWLKQQNLLTAINSESIMAKHYQLVYRMYQVGNANKLELYQAQGQWEEQKVSTKSAKNELEQTRLTLATLIGIDKSLVFTVTFDLENFTPVGFPDESIQSSVQQASQDRPEIRKTKINHTIVESQIKIAEAGYLPTVALSGIYKLTSPELTTKADSSLQLVLSISGTLFDGYSSKNEIDSAKLNLKKVELQEKLQQDQIFADVAQSLQSLKQSQDMIQSTKLNIDFMKERIRLTELQYNNGKSTTNDFIDAQSALDKALNSYYGQIMNYLKALAKLDYAMGKDVAK